MLEWLKQYRIRALEVDLAAVDAAIAAEERFMALTRTGYRSVMRVNAMERARILKRLEQLRLKPSDTK